jgi:hypothetical protein
MFLLYSNSTLKQLSSWVHPGTCSNGASVVADCHRDLRVAGVPAEDFVLAGAKADADVPAVAICYNDVRVGVGVWF